MRKSLEFNTKVWPIQQRTQDPFSAVVKTVDAKNSPVATIKSRPGETQDAFAAHDVI